MRHLALIITISCTVLFSSCGSSEISTEEGKKLAEQMLTDLKNNKLDLLDNYFTASFNQSEPLDLKQGKYQRLKETTGPVQSFEFYTQDKKYDEASGYNQLTLVYKVVCKRVRLKETFIIVKDEGKPGIMFHNIENWEEM